MKMFARLFALALALSIVSTTHAAEPTQVLNVWPGKPPGDHATTEPERDMTKPTDRPVAGKAVIRLGNVATPTISVFLPPKEKRNGATVVICPGGGFNILAFDLEGTEVAEWLNSLGVAGIVLKYRVPTGQKNPRWQMPAQDAQRALSLVRSKAAEWGLDPQRIGLLGFSAGGMTAAMASLQSAKNGMRLYDAADDVDKVSCRPDFVALIYPAYLVDNNQQLIPEAVVTKDTPPTFFAHAYDDPVRCESSVQLFLALKRMGVPSELHIYDAGGHGYGLRVTDMPVTSWPKRCEEWLRRGGWLKARTN